MIIFGTIIKHPLCSSYEAFGTLYCASSCGSVVKNPPANAGDIRDWSLISGSRRSPGEGNGNPLQYSCPVNSMHREVQPTGLPRVRLYCVTEYTVVKNPPANAGDIRDIGSVPGWGRSSGGRNGNPLQYSCLENPMDRGAWLVTVHSVSRSQT